jgi:predicted membrane-bound dolichyl-phosphate-mannose-protein mannosyltransferase
MRRVVLSLFACVLILFSFNIITYADVDNIVLNGGFEEGVEDAFFWRENVWESDAGEYDIKVVTGQAKSGNNCVKISCIVENDARLTQDVTVDPGTLYKISGWIKTEDVGMEAKGANLSVWLLMETSTDIKGTSDWTYVEMFGRTGANQSTLNFTIGVGGHGSLNTGTAYFDDIKIEKTVSIPEDATIVSLDNNQSDNNEVEEKDSSGNMWLIIGIVLLVLAIVAVIFFVFNKTGGDKGGSNDKSDDKADSGNDVQGSSSSKIDRKDLIIMAVMTLVYSVISLVNLGTTNVPETYWQPAKTKDSFIVNFDREYNLSKIAVYSGIGDLKLQVYYRTENGTFTPGVTIKQNYDDVLRWRDFDLQTTTDAIRVIVDQASRGTINEMVFFEKGNYETPIQISAVKEEMISDGGRGKVENLFDEQDVGDYTYNYMNSSYFDEIYHPRTAFEHLNRMSPYETTHPPLGKVIMAIGIAIFGMNPFGWRFMGTLFGIAMVPAMYLLGKKIFKKRMYGIISAFLITFEFMHFAQTRIGTIDSYPAFFVILAYYFMFDYFMSKSYQVGLKKSLYPLLLSGVFWGLGCASKWTAVYAGGGLAVLYFSSLIMEIIDYQKALRRKNKKRPAWLEGFIKKNVIYTSLCCIVFFVVIPVSIYIASYLPIITLPGDNYDLGYVWENTKGMFDYHSDLEDDHPYASPAYSWPLISKPLAEYFGNNLPPGKVSKMYVLGNPAVFWFGLVCVFFAIAMAIRKKDKRLIPIVVAFAFQYVPWFLVSRCVFIYHFFTSVPFLILCIVYVLYYLCEHLPEDVGKAYGSKMAAIYAYKASTSFVYIYLLINVLLFILFYPAISGMVVDSSYIKLVNWLGIG